jgi:predicted O-methyltransferase YrrM
MPDAPVSANPTPAPEPLIRMPAAQGAKASLSPLEKGLLAHFILLTRPRLIVEIGVYEAVTTAFMLELIALNGLPSRIVGFDLAEVIARLRKENQAVQEGERCGRLQLVEGWLPDSLEAWTVRERPVVDLALVDAQHDFPHVTWELAALWNVLAPEGVILGHDYCTGFDGVRYAFDAFARRQGGMLLPLGSSLEAVAAGHTSVLVALRRPAHQPSARGWLTHHWQGAKAQFARTAAWRNVLRPLIRGRDAASS